MDLFGRRLKPSPAGDYAGRLAALEDYVEYLRQQGEYGLSQAERTLTGSTADSRIS